MTTRASAVSPRLLTWARERAGLTIEDVAAYLSKDAPEVAAWEAGSSWPTYKQLEKLAEGLYRRPVALFFFPEPPEEPDPQQEFRTLPDFDIDALSSDTRYAIRLARSYQTSLQALTGGVNPAEHRIWRELQLDRRPDIETTATRVRQFLGISFELQRAWRTTADAMAGWRAAVESVGIYVFKRSFKQREVFGFCLTDDEFPIVMVNNSTAFTRQIFTLLHELAHLLHGINSITTVDGQFVARMAGSRQEVEVYCNRLAAECLVPSGLFPWGRVDRANIEESVALIAREFNVSREVILRRLLDERLVDATAYRELVARWADESTTSRSGEGGDYYNTQAAYLGDAYLKLAFTRYRSGLIEVAELAEHLGVKARNISKLEERIAGRL